MLSYANCPLKIDAEDAAEWNEEDGISNRPKKGYKITQI